MAPVHLNGSPKYNQSATAPESGPPPQPSANFTTIDLEMFAKLGIPISLLAEAGICRVTDAEARTEYGITGPSSRDTSGIIFPYFSPVDGRRNTARLRRDHPEVDVDGNPKNKYLCPYGDPRHLYFPPRAAEVLKDPDTIVVLVESEKASLGITAWAQRVDLKLVALGMGGCYGWSGRNGIETTPKGERQETRGPLADLAYCCGRKVIVLLDSNVTSNPMVRAAQRDLVKALHQKGAQEVLIADLPLVPGCNGPDDFVSVEGDDAMATVLGSAHAPDGRIAEAQRPAVRRGYLRMPHSVLQHGPALGPYGLAVALVLADHADSHGTCWPSVRRIMESSGIGAQATVQKALEKLSDLGVIEIQKSRQGFITKHLYRFIGWNGEPASAISSDASAPFHRMKSNKNQRTRTKNSMGGDSISCSLSTPRSQQVAESRNGVEVSNSPIDDSCHTDSPDETAKELFTIQSGNTDSAFIEGEL